jgi:hypothetical protein
MWLGLGWFWFGFWGAGGVCRVAEDGGGWVRGFFFLLVFLAVSFFMALVLLLSGLGLGSGVGGVAVLGVNRAVQTRLGRDVVRLAGCCPGVVVVNLADAGGLARAVVCWEGVLRLPLVGQELVDEAFCLVVGWRVCPAQMRWHRVVGDERALAAVGAG